MCYPLHASLLANLFFLALIQVVVALVVFMMELQVVTGTMVNLVDQIYQQENAPVIPSSK